MNNSRPLYLLLPLILVVGMIIGCAQSDESSLNRSASLSESIVGRWKVTNYNRRMHRPSTLFWFSMDHIEFREDGRVLGLFADPLAGGELRLNGQATYSVIDETQIDFIGSCRHEDPCTGHYSISRTGDEQIRIFSDEGKLELERIGPASETIPPRVTGPSPSPTP